MEMDVWFAYLIACLVLTVTPGPSIFLGVIHSLNFGVRRTLFTALGDISANFLQMLLVAVGLGVIIASSAFAFTVIKWFGVLTLLYMGAKMLFASRSELQQQTQLAPVSNLRLYLSGFMVAAGNPKALVFFSAFFPQFIDTSQPIFMQLAIMCPTMALLDFSMVMLYAICANRVLHTATRRLAMINRISGGVLIGGSAALALSTR